MHGNGAKVMTKRKKSSELVRARKETKRLQRETNTRIRKATKKAKKSGDQIELKKIHKIKKTFSNSLKPVGKAGLPKTYTHNVMWEKGRALELKRLNNRTVLSKKKKKRQTKKTFEKLFGKEKTKKYYQKIGGSEMNKLSNELWEQLYKAQDMLFAAGIVPADEIMGKTGSIGSGLLETGKELVNSGYWAKVSIELGKVKFENNSESASIKLSQKTKRTKIKSGELSEAIVKWYKQQYGMR